MCFVLTWAFLSQDKIAFVWLKEKQCTQVISQWKTQRVYSFSAVFIIYSCGGPAVAKKRKCKNPPDSGREPKVSIWLYIVKICSERRLLECSNWLTRQIFIRKINIREEICYCITAYLNRVCENSTYLINFIRFLQEELWSSKTWRKDHRINPLVTRRHICATYIDKFVENLVLKISQFCFLGMVRLCIGLNFRKSEVWKLQGALGGVSKKGQNQQKNSKK
jgi:hypothetical protein